MKKFLIKTGIFSAVLLVSIYVVFTLADGQADPFYVRFTTPKQHSLILGSSKAAQGIIPSVINSEIPQSALFNFSFTVGQSPYGPAYLKGIKKKLDTTGTNGNFIITVDAFSISANKENPEDEQLFPENNSFLAKTGAMDASPNIDYLVHHYPEPFYKILVNKSPLFLHHDGWLEVTVNDAYLSSDAALERSIKDYKNRVKEIAISTKRLEYLSKTIKYLKNYGEVYVVRMPVSPEIFKIEDAYLPNFEQLLQNKTTQLNVPYKSFSPQNMEYEYTDGLHLYKQSGIHFSKDLAAWILSIKNNE